MQNRRFFTHFVAFLLGIVIFSCADYFYPNFYHKSVSSFAPLRESSLSNSTKYKYIDPLLAIYRPDDFTSPEFVNLKKDVNEYLNEQVKNKNLSVASVYFRGQKSSGGFTINPDEKYGMASLIKVPLMIGYFKLAQRDPSVLTKEITYTGSFDYNKDRNILSEKKLKKGDTYKVSELIDYMIKYSDNNAYSLLANNLNITNTYEYVNNLFNDLGISEIAVDRDNIEIGTYSLFFRVLYNSTYFNRTYSEKAMEILANTDYKKGIGASLPGDVEVAQKYGEAVIKNERGVEMGREFHNCGIVYYLEAPYLLCIMTKGRDLSVLQDIVANVSKMVYEEYQVK